MNADENMGLYLMVIILIAASAALFALGYIVGRRSRPTEQRGFDVVAAHDEKQH